MPDGGDHACSERGGESRRRAEALGTRGDNDGRGENCAPRARTNCQYEEREAGTRASSRTLALEARVQTDAKHTNATRDAMPAATPIEPRARADARARSARRSVPAGRGTPTGLRRPGPSPQPRRKRKEPERDERERRRRAGQHRRAVRRRDELPEPAGPTEAIVLAAIEYSTAPRCRRSRIVSRVQ